jgi:ribosomal-protein-alanine N-acetyltransferase
MPDSAGTICAARIDLVPFTAGFLRASLAGRLAEAEQLLGASLPAKWPDYPPVHRLRLSQLEADPTLLRWLMRGMVLRSERRLIGHIGFHTAPGPDYLSALAPGGVEFGFEVFAHWQRQGFATEAADALMQWARREHGITRFIVSISPANTPSLGLAAKFGFRRIGSHLDEEDGPEDIFERMVE